MASNKKFRTIREVYETGDPIEKPAPKKFKSMSSLYGNVLLNELTVEVDGNFIGEIEPDRVEELKKVLADPRNSKQKIKDFISGLGTKVKELAAITGFGKGKKTGPEFLSMLKGRFMNNDNLMTRHIEIIDSLVEWRKNASGAMNQALSEGSSGDGNSTIHLKHQLQAAVAKAGLDETQVNDLFTLLHESKPNEMPAVGQGEFIMSCIYDMKQMSGKAAADLISDTGIRMEVKGKDARPGSGGALYSLQTIGKLQELLGTVDLEVKTSITKIWKKIKDQLELIKTAESRGEVDGLSQQIELAMPLARGEGDFYARVDAVQLPGLTQLLPTYQQGNAKTKKIGERLAWIIDQLTWLGQEQPQVPQDAMIKKFANTTWGAAATTFVGHALRAYRESNDIKDYEKVVTGLYHMRNHEQDPGGLLDGIKEVFTPDNVMSNNDLHDNMNLVVGAIQLTSYAHNHDFDYITYVNEENDLGSAVAIKTAGVDTSFASVYNALKSYSFRVTMTIDESQGKSGVQIAFIG